MRQGISESIWRREGLIAIVAAVVIAGVGTMLRFAWHKVRARYSFENGFVSTLVCFSLNAWLLLYAIVVARTVGGGTLSDGERLVIGAVVDLHYLLSWLDRSMRPLDDYSKTAPFAAAVAATMFIVAPGNVFATAPVLVAIALYQYGYIVSEARGRYLFGVPMSIVALIGDIAIMRGDVSLGETLLVVAGLLAGVRSIVAILIGDETRRWTSPGSDGNDNSRDEENGPENSDDDHDNTRGPPNTVDSEDENDSAVDDRELELTAR
jgi:hypothetical protein